MRLNQKIYAVPVRVFVGTVWRTADRLLRECLYLCCQLMQLEATFAKYHYNCEAASEI
jgi:hypothetical protein